MAYGTFKMLDIVFNWIQIKIQYYQLIYFKNPWVPGSIPRMRQSFEKPWLSAFKMKP